MFHVPDPPVYPDCHAPFKPCHCGPPVCPHGYPLDDPNAEPCYHEGCYDPPKEKTRKER